ncbi:glucosaminidase domain-containing protein [Parasphingopyxis sp.]|uniref:glucosaminidase domain-containing protein n=1 Tax=Parasphingopyxis sp. TaxID=1920299 RepID=UPI002629B7BF|nr:glucosaminidase domain-containing protein [Parasphingopyxis sp.]
MAEWENLIVAAKDADISAPKLRAITLAQWALESGRATSRLAKDHHNYAGLKWRPEMEGFAESVSYEAHDGTDDYCAFASPEAFIKGYWRFIGRSVYEGWQTYAEDPAGYICFLKSRGYAGDPHYLSRVLKLLPEAEQLLEDAETGVPAAPVETKEDVDRPPRAEIEAGIHAAGIADPLFITEKTVKQKFKGKRPNGLEGAIVHFDAGRRLPTRGPDDPEFGALGTLRYAQKAGYAYATISRSGRIYLPANIDWEQWGSHAGKSKCPATNRNWVSQFYVGFEVNCPGWVYPTADTDLFIPWFEAKRKSNGKVITDGQGRATPDNDSGEHYSAAQVRHIGSQTGNMRTGYYVPYTAEQMEALFAVMLWLKRRNPDVFSLDRVFGHDEVAPTRKSDPGGSLGAAGEPAMPMADFRAKLHELWDIQG